MMEWIFDKLPVIIFVVIFVGQILRGFFKMRGSRQEPPATRHNELEEARRTQEIQAEIRRKIAERRAGREAPPTASETRSEQSQPPVVVERDPTAIPVPEPLRRMLEQLERKVQPPVAPPPMLPQRTAELERQERLAEEMRVLEEAKATAARRAAQLAAARAEHAHSEEALRTAARGRLVDQLHDPESLRRAFVLREILGTPVGLR